MKPGLFLAHEGDWDMPQTDFFADASDEQSLVRLFFKLGFELVPELTYADANLIYVADFDSYEKIQSKASSYFLWHKECVSSPLRTFKVAGSGWNAGRYAIFQRQGGPTLHFVCHLPATRDGVQIVPAGLVSYYATYKNTTTSVLEKIPATLRSKYKAIVRDIKRMARKVQFDCVEGGSRTYWIMPGALATVRNGGRLGVQRIANLPVKGLEDVPWALGPQE
jgi:hypothetical protein